MNTRLLCFRISRP